MDSFEASTQFTQILKGLTPSIQNLTRAAHFALKNSESEDYLFHTIIDTLDDPNIELNTKSTIFQFIEVLMHESLVISLQPKSHYTYPYVHNLKNSLPKILLKVLPGSNNSSLYNAYNSLKNISETCKISYDEYEKKYSGISELFTDEDLENIEANLPFPDIKVEDEIEASDPLITTWDLLIKKKKQSQYERLRLLKHLRMIEECVEEEDMFSYKGGKSQKDQNNGKANELLLSKKHILLRMEDDRETHKRSKENIWVVNRPKDASILTEDEFLVHYWNKYRVMAEEEEKTFMDSLDELNGLVVESYKDKQF